MSLTKASFSMINGAPANVLDFGAVGDGVTDDTAAIQAALDSGALSVFIPAGSFLCSSLLMPSTTYFTLHGTGQSSTLVQKAGSSNALIRWDTGSIVYTQGLIQGIQIKGTNGSSDCINTSGVGGITLQDIYILDVPVGYSGIYLNGIPSEYNHDQRVINLQVYSNTVNGFAGVRLGPKVADCNISNYICNNNFKTKYCIYADAGAQTTTLEDSHIYNAALNIMKCEGTNSSFTFNQVVFDNATENLIELTSTERFTFVNCFFQAIKAAKVGVNLTNTNITGFHAANFNNAFGSVAAIVENGTADYTTVWGGDTGNNSNYTGDAIVLLGVYSWASGLAGWNPFGIKYSFSGVSQTEQAQATVQYLGTNGIQASKDATEYLIPYDSKLTVATILASVKPAAGQTYTFEVYDDTTLLGTLTVNDTSFGGDLTLNANASKNARIYIKSTFSATSGSAYVRYCLRFTA